MSEFDFDELDKAVAGVLSTEADPVVDEVEALDDTNMTNDLPVIEEKSETSKVAPAARRSSGRFMDVVHPSSDMRTRSAPAFIGGAPSESEQSFTPPVTKPQPEVKSTFEPTTEESMSLDTASDSLEAAVGEWTKPLESPFLSDAKVEKRPLGGVGPEPSQVLLEAPEEELMLEAPDEPLLEATFPDPIDFAAQSAALSTEKEDTGGEQPAEEPVVEEQAPVIKEVVTPQEPIGPTSITQQYTEQQGATQQSGAIFDTENYHKPLTVAAKKHSGVWTIIWILLLVILGAGAGVAFYLFVLPML